MRFRIVAVVSLAVLCAAAPPPPSPAPKVVAPESFPHSVALFLSSLSNDGRQRIAFKAAALGTHFFFEETTGVSVYIYDGIGYKRQAFLKGFTMGQALAKYRTVPKPAPPPVTTAKKRP